jgi:hypothetical protein
MHLQWINQSRTIPISTLINYIPVIATVITSVLSLVLARATLRYAEATDKSLALAREEFEREWSPELHIKLERLSSTDARVVVTNLAKISVLLQLLQMRKTSLAVPFGRYFLNDPLVGGMTWTENIGKRLLACTGDNFDGQIAAAITFYASGRLFRTDWFRFHIHVNQGSVLRIDPVNIAARRVRVLEHRRLEQAAKREPVKDVTGEPAVVVSTDDGEPV